LAWHFQSRGLRRKRSLKWRTYVRFNRNQMSGNPVKIGDGCATVTGYRLPKPLAVIRPGRRERGKARSQDTGLNALVRSDESKVQRPMSKVESTLDVGPWTLDLSGQLLRQEKDEASPFRVCGSGFTECLHSLFCRDEGFFVVGVPPLGGAPKPTKSETTNGPLPLWSLNQ